MSVVMSMPSEMPIVELPSVEFVTVGEVRRAIVGRGDIRGEIGFQNDINALIAAVDELRVPWQAVGERVGGESRRSLFSWRPRRAA